MAGRWKRAGALMMALLLLTGCTITERLEEDDSALDLSYAGQQEAGTVALGYYTAQTIDPIRTTSTVNRIICEALYEGLFYLDDQFQPQPLLCESWTVNGTEVRLTLKEGVSFWSGAPLTASDVVYSYQLAKKTATSPYYERASYMSSIRAADDRTVVIQLTAPNSRILSLLDIPILREGTESQTFAEGTGPYQPVQEEKTYVLRANENWHGGAITGVTEIALSPTNSADAVVSSFAAGDISMTRAERISDSPATIQGAVEIYQTPTTELHYLGIRMSHPLLANPVFRRALSAAIDRESICRTALQTFADPAVFPQNPQPDAAAAGGYTAQLDLAQTLLAQIGVTDSNGDGVVEYTDAAGGRQPVVLRLVYNNDNTYKATVCNQLVTAFGQLGIRLELTGVPFEQYLAALNNGNFDLYYGDLVLSPDFDLRALLMTGGSNNFGRVADTGLDSRIIAVRNASADTLESAENALTTYFLEQMPIVPLAFERNQVILRGGLIQNFAPQPAQMFWNAQEWRQN